MTIQHNAPVPSMDQKEREQMMLKWEYMRPKPKLSETDEMAIYATKYGRKPRVPPQSIAMKGKPMKGMSSKLRLLKKRSIPTPQIRNNHTYYRRESQGSVGPVDWKTQEIEQRIANIEQELQAPSLSSSKKYALNKSLKMEKSKIIRRQRKIEQEKRRMDAGAR